MICPIMSRPMNEVGAHDQPIVDVHFVDCQEEKCALWATVYTTESTPTSGCALELNAHKDESGRYAV